MQYMTPKEAAARWGISQRRVHALCLQGRIKGAERHGWTWLIPATTDKPRDARVRSGRYVKPGRGSSLGHTEPGLPDHESASIPMQAANASLIARPRLVAKIAPPGSKLTYIHAGAGYGKTTLLMQYARDRRDVVWLSLDERDSDVPHFLRHLEEAFKAKLRHVDFHAMDHIPFVGRKAFVPNVLAALLSAVGGRKITLILDDVHVLDGSPAAHLLSRLAVDCPPSLTLIMASRHEPWGGLYRLKVEGRVAEIDESDLRFSQAEAEELWGFFDEAAYSAAEGWALALQSYRMVAADQGKPSLPEADRNLERYLMEEILGRLHSRWGSRGGFYTT